MINVIMSPKTVKEQEFTNKKACAFCNISDDDELKYGKIYEHDGIVTHYYCLLLSSNMQQRGRDDEGILGFLRADIQKELNRGRRLNCTYCKKKGATLGCVNKKCKKVFHYPCGIKANTLHQFFGQFKSFCPTHRPKQHIDLRVRSEASDHLLCYICYESVQREDIYKTLWAPCCKKNAWFHRDCVQQLALSAGYFFKCPLCNNKKEFQKSMQECGIFVPCQDASWELVPNAFQELLYRHNRCDSINCICPQGPTHASTNARWEIILCRTCGSQGIHVGCGKLKWMNPTWECDECSSILQKSNLSGGDQLRYQEPITNSSCQDISDDDSDSDISAGRESPYENVAQTLKAINLKPGPRSAKLKQLHQQVETISPDKSGHTATLEQLNVILNEQQANDIPDEMLERKKTTDSQETHEKITIDIQENYEKKTNNSQENHEKRTANSHKNHEKKNADSRETHEKKTEDLCIITVDDDDDIDVPIQNPQQSKVVNNPVESSSSIMNIKITEVTSLPPEVFASVPDAPFSEENQFQNNMIPTSQFDFQDERKADSPSVVSRIVNRVNDYIDIPELCPKKPRMDENFIATDGVPLHPAESLSQAYNRFTVNYSNDANVNSTHIPLNGQFRNTYNGFNGQVMRLDYAKDSGLSNSGGGAGTRPADELADNVAWDAVFAPELSALPECTSQFSKSDTELSKFDSGLSNEDHGGRRSCNDSRSEEWISECSFDRSECHESAGSHRLRLMRESILLKDLKFHVCEGDDIEITVCNDYKFKITLDTSKKINSVNTHRHLFCDEHDLTRSSPVRRSRATYHNRIEDLNYNSSTINLSNNNIELKKPYRISDLKDANKNHFSYSFDSTHSLRLRRNDKNELSECYKYNNNKDVAKENLVPEKFEKKNNNSDSLALGKNFNGFLGENEGFPGTSRDNFKELSVNQRYFVSSNNSNYYINRNKNRKSKRRNLSKSPKHDIQCHVSIDLNRIQSLIDSKPNLFSKTNGNLVKTPSLNDLQINFDSKNNLNTINKKKRMRSKSDSSIYLSTIELDQFSIKNHIFSNKKRKKRKRQTKKKNCIERYDYCR